MRYVISVCLFLFLVPSGFAQGIQATDYDRYRKSQKEFHSISEHEIQKPDCDVRLIDKKAWSAYDVSSSIFSDQNSRRLFARHAERCYTRSLERWTEIQKDPDHPYYSEAALGIARSHHMIGCVLLQQGCGIDAKKHFAEAEKHPLFKGNK